MSIFPVHRHVLEDHITGFDSEPAADHLAVVRHPVIFSVLAEPGRESETAEALRLADDIVPRRCGPVEWLAVSQTADAETVAGRLADIEGTAFVEQSDGRVLIVLTGSNSRRLLAKCVAIDLHPQAFGDGEAANLLCCGAPANLARVGADGFELVLPRTLAGSVMEELVELGREFGLTRGFVA